jgi:hypothetical protein
MRNYGVQGARIKLRLTATAKLIINFVLCSNYMEMIFIGLFIVCIVVPCILITLKFPFYQQMHFLLNI